VSGDIRGRSKADRTLIDAPLDSGQYSAVSTVEMIEKEVAALPEPQQREVFDFARFLRSKNAEDSFNGLLLSESALAKDWNTPEEDAAWASL
jgi:hypothetical protein